MILIIQNYNESNLSHNEVVDWLIFRKAEFEFLTGKQYYENGEEWSINLNNQQEEFSNDFSNVRSVWFRGFLRHRSHFKNILKDLNSTNDNIAELRWRISQEIFKINNQVFYHLRNAFKLPDTKAVKVDKFEVLRFAKNLGLDIPPSLLTNSKKELLEFVEIHKEIITKPLYETVYFQTDKEVIFFKTEKINKTQINNLPETFFPSYFQKYIKKDIEIRVFYLEGKFFPMAIFSQLDPQTSTDFRNYNDKNPNRNVPYSLPKFIESKLELLMQKIGLNTGSIDIIKTPNKKYYFLEVNPTGQFGFVSKPCNYYLEDEISQTLIKND